MRTFLAAAAMVITMGSAANAANVGSAPAYGGPTQSVVVCYYLNVGNSSIAFNSSRIFIEPGDPVGEANEFCIGLMGPGQRCRTVSVTIANNAAHWCRANVSNKDSLRGRMEIRDSTGNVLTSEEIR